MFFTKISFAGYEPRSSGDEATTLPTVPHRLPPNQFLLKYLSEHSFKVQVAILSFSVQLSLIKLLLIV